MLSLTNLTRCIATLETSLAMYRAAPLDSIEQEVFRNAIVKGYELAQETAYKLLKKKLRDLEYSTKKLNDLSVKDLLRLAARHNLLTPDEVERWFAYRDNRNDTAHEYGVGFAQDTLALLPGFIHDVRSLAAKLAASAPLETE